MTTLNENRATFTKTLAYATTPGAALEALYQFCQSVAPVKLFTIMAVDMDAMLAGRTFTNNAEVYPVSGTKPIIMNDWFDGVHKRHETYVANVISEVKDMFPDYETIAALGCGSVLNMPVVAAGQLVATVNLLDVEGYFTDEVVARIEGAFRLPAMAALWAENALA